MDDIKGYLYVTSTGYDPERGLPVKDPYLGDQPTLGACMTNIRRQVVEGDRIFVVSGKIQNVPQYVIGGFEVAEKIHAFEAYERFPELRLHLGDDGEVRGNIICDRHGDQHQLDHHSNFAGRLDNYVVGRNPIVLSDSLEISRARRETMDVISQLTRKPPQLPMYKMLGRGGTRLDRVQIDELCAWLSGLKVK